MNINTQNVLRDLVEFNDSINNLEKRVSFLTWDISEDHVFLNKNNILKVLEKFQDGYLTDNEVERWANLIECREGIFFLEEIKDIIYELANPDLTFKLQNERATYLIKMLKKSG